MKTRFFILLFLLMVLLNSCFRNQPMVPKQVLLHDNWSFHKAGSDTVYPARIPGCVHLDLMNNGVIPDPYFGDNEEEVQWIEEEDWVYKTTFRAAPLLLGYSHIDLVFEGLDTYADVYLNDSLVLSADNMFREWRVEVKNLLNKGHNDLKIVFHSPPGINREKASDLPYSLPDERAFSRKAPYMFGWDWGPRLVTSGIWKPVFFEAWESLQINHWQVITDSLGSDRARLRLRVHVNARDSMSIDCRYKVSVKDRETVPFQLTPGGNWLEIPFTLENPRLWWTYNLGEPFLYDFTVSFRQGDETIDRARGKFGVRTIELVHQPDEYGRGFYFKLNGVPVFMKGANYIPQDNFPSRVSRDKYHETLSNACRANINMLRVWGGGIYEDEYFYSLCDRWGILVWQDFMFACTMYPGDSAFLNNVKEEAIQQVKRLRTHPSLALWCGNNEVDEAWHNWGWQQQFGYSDEDSAAIWEDYLKVFHDLLPGVVEEYDGVTPYWPSSPKHGWGRKESRSDGDMHYWGVWWGREPFSAYNTNTGRFMSEYGFQAYPAYKTLEETLPAEDLFVGSPSLLNHQKHPFGEEVIREFMERSYPVPSTDELEDYTYLSQLVQAYGIRAAIEAHRRNMPRCMGTLYWQYNDCWPVISWSGLDYHNRWKALHYFVKRSYEDIIICPVQEDGKLNIYLVNDLLEDTTGKLAVTSMDFSGAILFQDSVQVNMTANSSLSCYSKSIHSLLKTGNPENTLIKLTFASDNETLVKRIVYFSEPARLQLTNPDIAVNVEEDDDRLTISIRTDELVKDLYLSFEKDEGRFSDNFFDLLPGEEKTLFFYPDDEDRLPGKNDLVIRHLNGIFLHQHNLDAEN